MKLKLDENLGTRGQSLLRRAGHDAVTVSQQGLSSTSDRVLIDICRSERRCLITLDTGFANPLTFHPADYAGIAVLRFAASPTPAAIDEAIATLIGGLARRNLEGRLWVVLRARIREYSGDEP